MPLFVDTAGRPGRLHWWCPGCRCLHLVHTQPQPEPSPVWTMTGPPDKPTIRPSILTRGGAEDRCCHVFITEGQIEYLHDCNHALAGKTVPMDNDPFGEHPA